MWVDGSKFQEVNPVCFSLEGERGICEAIVMLSKAIIRKRS